MKEHIIEAITSGIIGKWTHLDPKKAFLSLSPGIAKRKPSENVHSCWELLHHIVVWQEAILEHIKGKKVDWNEIENRTNWPTIEELNDESNFENLVSRFEKGVKETQRLLKHVNFKDKSVGFPELSIIKLFIVILQHNSYHIGQIVTTRKLLGDWPSAKE